MIRVLSYNVMFGRKSRHIFPWLSRQNHDIICLQEFPERKIDELVFLLPENRYSYAFAPSMKIFKKIYGELTLYRKNTLTLKKQTTIILGTNRVEKTFLLTKLPRTALLTEFRYRKKRFVLVNPQLVSLSSNTLRYAQVEKILDAVQNIKVPTFLIGDFNIPSLRAKNTLLRYMQVKGFSSYEDRFRTYRLTFMRWQLDYAFARNGKIQKITVERVKFSDHYPIQAEIVI